MNRHMILVICNLGIGDTRGVEEVEGDFGIDTVRRRQNVKDFTRERDKVKEEEKEKEEEETMHPGGCCQDCE